MRAGALLLVAMLAVVPRLSAQLGPTYVTLPGYRNNILMDTVGTFQDLEAPRAKVVAALFATLDQLKIPLEVRDSAAGMAGNLGLVKMHSFAGSQLSRWISCGDGMSGPNADLFRVYLALMTKVRQLDAGQVRVTIALLAGAKDVTTGASDPVACGSTGALEARIVKGIRDRLRGS